MKTGTPKFIINNGRVYYKLRNSLLKTMNKFIINDFTKK